MNINENGWFYKQFHKLHIVVPGYRAAVVCRGPVYVCATTQQGIKTGDRVCRQCIENYKEGNNV